MTHLTIKQIWISGDTVYISVDPTKILKIPVPLYFANQPFSARYAERAYVANLFYRKVLPQPHSYHYFLPFICYVHQGIIK
jgi:hypothetical protein